MLKYAANQYDVNKRDTRNNKRETSGHQRGESGAVRLLDGYICII